MTARSAPQLNWERPRGPAAALGEALNAIGSHQTAALLVVQIRNIDQLRCTFGFRASEFVVADIGARLANRVRVQDALYALTDASFAVVLAPLTGSGLPLLAANKFLQVADEPIPVGPQNVPVRLQIGIALAPEHGRDADELLRNAGAAAFAAGMDAAGVVTYDDDLASLAHEALQLEHELAQAIAENELSLHFQPKVASGAHVPQGAEALVRWHNRRRGWVGPDEFVPIAERSGLIEPLTTWVLGTALRRASEWPRQLSVSVNLSPRMLLGDDIVGLVRGSLPIWDIEPQRLIMEITEGALVADPDTAFDVLNALRALGVRISIDDFGAGYSSLAYFRNIPADELKIDKSFVLNMLDNEADERIVRTIIQLAKQFDLTVIAEGVEDGRTADHLAAYGCDQLQGYFFARPIPNDAFLAWLAEPTPVGSPVQRFAGPAPEAPQ